MPATNVEVGQVIKASTMNAVVDHVQAANGRRIFVVGGTWSVPVGVTRFKVTLCGGGGRGHASVLIGYGEDSYYIAGGPGGDAPMISAIFEGVEEGTSFDIDIGVGGYESVTTGGTTSFGTEFSSSGGEMPGNSSGFWYDAITPKGGQGDAVFPAGVQHCFHDNGYLSRYVYHFGKNHPFGRGGRGGPGPSGYGGTYESLHSPGPENGAPGVCVIEW